VAGSANLYGGPPHWSAYGGYELSAYSGLEQHASLLPFSANLANAFAQHPPSAVWAASGVGSAVGASGAASAASGSSPAAPALGWRASEAMSAAVGTDTIESAAGQATSIVGGSSALRSAIGSGSRIAALRRGRALHRILARMWAREGSAITGPTAPQRAVATGPSRCPSPA